MSQPTPQIRALARRLIAHEARRGPERPGANPALFPVCDLLGLQLETLIGAGGFRALLARSLTLAALEVSWLEAVQVQADGTLKGGDRLTVRLTPAERRAGQVVLIAQLLGLLVGLIGPGLTLRMVGEIWPRFSPAGIKSLNGALT